MVRTRLPRLHPATALAAVASVALALVFAPAVSAADSHVDIAGFAFAPRSVTIHVGDSVTWENSDARSHTATADDSSFDTGTISNGATKSVTFSTAGTFGYHCSIHPDMTATVVVEAAVTPPATDAVPGDAAPDRMPRLALLGLATLGGLVVARRLIARADDRTDGPTA